MPGYTLSLLAERDLNEIANYTRDRWGLRQAVSYIEGLRTLCQQLAETPTIGRSCNAVRPGLRRMEGGRHVVFIASARMALRYRAFCIRRCCLTCMSDRRGYGRRRCCSIGKVCQAFASVPLT